jgi:hypothetical protein
MPFEPGASQLAMRSLIAMARPCKAHKPYWDGVLSMRCSKLRAMARCKDSRPRNPITVAVSQLVIGGGSS